MLNTIYNFYVLMLAVFFMLPLAFCALLIPNIKLRRLLTGRIFLLTLWLVGIRVTIAGQEHFIHKHMLAVANHRSYLDGPILNSVLPPQFGFVIKREVTAIPGINFILRRLGAYFVSRSNIKLSAKDGTGMIAAVRQGLSFCIFPEGGYSTSVTELSTFRAGAFLAAVRAQVPVLPIAVIGTEHILPADTYRLHPGIVNIVIGAPIYPSGSNPDAARALAMQARTVIEKQLNQATAEP